MKYLYDGTFMGFLTVVYHSYYDHALPTAIESRALGSDLFQETRTVTTDSVQAEKVGRAFCEKCGKRAFSWLYRAFLCDDESEMCLWNYVRNGFRLEKSMYRHQKDLWMWEILIRAHKTGNEAEKFKGILRFSELEGGLLYAQMKPTHHILPLLVSHFKDRLGRENWAIHDLKRQVACYFHDGTLMVGAVEEPRFNLSYDEKEKWIQNLWKGYHMHMAIGERYNPTVQRGFLPKKYWPFLTEMT